MKLLKNPYQKLGLRGNLACYTNPKTDTYSSLCINMKINLKAFLLYEYDNFF